MHSCELKINLHYNFKPFIVIIRLVQLYDFLSIAYIHVGHLLKPDKSENFYNIICNGYIYNALKRLITF